MSYQNARKLFFLITVEYKFYQINTISITNTTFYPIVYSFFLLTNSGSSEDIWRDSQSSAAL